MVSRLTERSTEQRELKVRDLHHLVVSGQLQRSQSIGFVNFSDQSSLGIVQQLVEEILTMSVDIHQPKSKKLPQCHQCHAPLSDEVHVGIPCGVGRCTLHHWEGCEGGIPGGTSKNGKLWAGCPSDSSGSETDCEDEENEEKLDSTVDSPGVKTAAEDSLPGATSLMFNLVESSPHIAPLSQIRQEQDSECSDDEDLLRQREELARLRKEFHDQELASQAAAKAARSAERRHKRNQEKAEIARQTQILKDRQASLLASSITSSRTSNLPASSTGTRKKTLKQKVTEHEANKARKAAEKLAKQQLQGDVTMGGIRALPGIRQEVEDYITSLKAAAPTLSADPTAVGFATTPVIQPAGVYAGQALSSVSPGTKFVYVEELGQVIPMVTKLSDLPASTRRSGGATRPVPVLVDSSESDSECSADEDCSLEPEPGTRFSWKKHNDGRKFFKPVPVYEPVPEMKVAYKLDKATGNYEQVFVTKQPQTQKRLTTVSGIIKTAGKSSSASRVSSHEVYKDHRATTSRGASVIVQREERQPSFVTSDPDKQGRESKLPSLVQYARDCPVSWTSKVTSTSLNPLLFSWAYIAELLATRTGQAPSLQDGELEARLQHYLSVLEVTLQTTTQTDFASDSWNVARLYHQKVQDKVDAGVYSWLFLSKQWGTATLPHELMAANAELAPRTVFKKKGERSPNVKKVEEKKGLCFSWNTSDTKGKCKWEVEHEGKKCIMQHYCTWCKSEYHKISLHQKAFCRKRLEKEGE